MRWTAARQCGCALAPPLDSGRPHVASHLGCRLSSGAASSCALDSCAARQLCAGAASRLEASVCRLPSLSPSEQRRGEAAMRWTAAWRGGCALAPPSTRGLRPSPLVSVAARTAAQRRGEQRLCRRLDSAAARQPCAGRGEYLWLTPGRSLLLRLFVSLCIFHILLLVS